jgi:hypothetical protein
MVYVHHRAPRIKIPGRHPIRRRAMKMGEHGIEATKTMFAVRRKFDMPIIAWCLSQLQELDCKISISLDAWTSSNMYAFMAIVAHYVNKDGQLGT